MVISRGGSHNTNYQKQGMSKQKVILTSIAAVIGIYYYRVVMAAKRLLPSVGSPLNFSLKGGQISFIVPLRFINSDSVSIPVNSVTVVNYIGVNEFGYTILQNKTNIAARSTSELPLQVTIPFPSIPTLGVEIFNQIKTTKSINLTFKGTVNSLGVHVPIEQKLTVSIPFI